MEPSSIGVNGEDLIIQPPIENLSLYPLFQFDYWGYEQPAPFTVMDYEECFIV